MDFVKIAKKWQEKWEKKKIFEAEVDKTKPKFFLTIPYPYVNGGPHLGAAFTYGRGDAYARFKRMQGFNVLFPQGFHATGEPIVGAIKRLKENDKEQIEAFKMYGISDEQLEEFKEKGPEFLARFWMNWWIEDLKNYGFSADWRRSFITAITPQYNKFIEWQYRILKEKGYVIQGTHPVVYCPKCKSPTGDHDRLVGEGESPIEYIILKFEFDGKIIPCGTLRPETIFGVTNIWINPEIEYFWCKVEDEIWLLSEKAAEKLKDQLKKIEIIERVSGKKLIGKEVENPVLKNKIPILPAKFVDPFSATGIVMSVPAHAPYDWIALKDIKENPEKFGVSKKVVENIEPISIIKIEGFGEFPAKEICEKLKIKSQEEKEKLDEATNEIYKKEYHTGILKENCKKYAGKKISKIKDEIINDFISSKIAEKMWEITGKVICRCKTQCHIKILENQWFLKFSDKKWKEKVKNCIEKMKFYPEEVKQQFLNTVDWLKDKACARKSGLGTKLPWDKEWIVETLSDSVIYMAYYTISKYINKHKIKAESLCKEVFDFVFLGKGDLNEISKKSKIKKEILKKMREEFEYFYPVDLRTSGKDLIQNHLTFFLFHHTAIWPEKYWPRAIAINGFVNVEGKKMSKRFGNVLILRDLLKKYGADLVRINLISSSEEMNDADWRTESLQSFKTRIEWIYELIKKLEKAKRKKKLIIDNFILSKAQRYIAESTENYEKLNFRSVTQSAFFSFINDLKWYVERNGKIENCNKSVLKNCLSVFVKLLTPIIPHICEEFWEMLGNKGFVSAEKWPEVNENLIDENSERAEEFLKQIIKDIKEIERIKKIKPKKIWIILAPQWKFKGYEIFMKNKEKKVDKIIKTIYEKTKANKEEIKNFVMKLFKKKFELEEKILERKWQLKILKEAKNFLQKLLNAKILIETAEKSKIEKGKTAMPFKPAIFIK